MQHKRRSEYMEIFDVTPISDRPIHRDCRLYAFGTVYHIYVGTNEDQYSAVRRPLTVNSNREYFEELESVPNSIPSHKLTSDVA